MRRSWIVLAGLIVTGCCSSAEADRAHKVTDCDYPCDDNPLGSFDWQAGSPVEFLEFLVREQEHGVRAGLSGGVFSVAGRHEGWIREEDIPALFALLDSQTPCASVKRSISSYIELGSTVGHEAGVLIMAFREGNYPFFLNSSHVKVDKEELREWWARHEARKQRPRPTATVPE
jgi:hypothetical protein